MVCVLLAGRTTSVLLLADRTASVLFISAVDIVDLTHSSDGEGVGPGVAAAEPSPFASRDLCLSPPAAGV
jgi:hypothetical protein